MLIVDAQVHIWSSGKPTNAKVATPENLQKISSEVDVVLIGLSD